jgi:mRNA interferase MazF
LNKKVPERGDVILINFNPTSGHEQAGFRPAIVLSPNFYNKASGLCLVCPITTKVKGYPFEVSMEESNKTHGVALADQIRSIDWQAREIKIVDHVPASIIETVLAKSKTLLL